MWLSLGDFSERKGGAFCINNVTGPDEYTAVVDNNRFTNMMARENLRAAVRAVNFVRQSQPAQFERLVERTRLDLKELDGWERAAERMYLPVDERTGIHPQDDSFLDKPRWECADITADKHPLLLYYHPLTLYRHQTKKLVRPSMWARVREKPSGEKSFESVFSSRGCGRGTAS